jgi:nucleoid-associated protein YgaU
MRLWPLTLAATAMLMLVGCNQPQEQTTAHQETALEPYQPLAEMDTPPATEDPYATDPYVTTTPEQPPLTPVADAPPPARYETTSAETPRPLPTARASETTLIASDRDTTGVRMHVVRRGDTFYRLARAYYNDETRWRDIWEANQTRVPNRNTLTIGTKLIIPD